MKKIAIIIFILAIYSFAQAQDMKGMDMSKKKTIQQPQLVTYTCVMHPEIHVTKPGNCPKCGMKLIKEKSKVVMQPTVTKHDEMQMLNEKTKEKSMDMGSMDIPKEKPLPKKKSSLMHHQKQFITIYL